MSIARFFTDAVTVETFEGSGALGDVYAASRDVSCAIEEVRQLVRSSTGEQVVSETRLFAPVDLFDVFAPQSRVTVNGRATHVIVAKRHQRGPSRLWHVEVSLL